MATFQIRPQVSDAQLEALWQFLNSHRDIAMGYIESAETRSHYQRMWERVTQLLNSLEGDIKDWNGWSTYWIEYKVKLKQKVAANLAVDDLTGEGPSQAVPLTDIEKKFFDILGNNNGLGTSRMPIDPFSEKLNQTNCSGTPQSQWVDENDNSTQTPFQPIGMTSVSTQSYFDMETTTSLFYGGVSQRTASTETERAVVAATQTNPEIVQSTSSAGIIRRRRRVSTPYPVETRRSLAVAAIAPNGLASRSNAFGGMISVLSRMVRALERIEARLNGAQLTGI